MSLLVFHWKTLGVYLALQTWRNFKICLLWSRQQLKSLLNFSDCLSFCCFSLGSWSLPCVYTVQGPSKDLTDLKEVYIPILGCLPAFPSFLVWSLYWSSLGSRQCQYHVVSSEWAISQFLFLISLLRYDLHIKFIHVSVLFNDF